ncbi:MAG: glycosyltransferase family 39 protein, partial [Chloroflexi bacterium]|nr:glycosyltransferase family 39 protein [Chloroflexota bacterium]
MGNQRRDTLVNRVLLATLLVAFALRLFRLDFQALWWDEGDTVYFATQNLPALTSATAADIHPPLYYYLLHFWTEPLGPGAFSVRFFSALISMLTIPLFYQLDRKLVPGRVSLLAVSLLAISPFH